MKKLIFLYLITQACGDVLAKNLRVCTGQADCNDDEVCVSYADCNGQQVKRCLARTCYRSGVGCPSDLVCNDKHCSVLGCR